MLVFTDLHSLTLLYETFQTQDLEYRTLSADYVFVVSGCKENSTYDIFNGWIRRSFHTAQSIQERYETLLTSFLSFCYVQEILMRE